MKTFQDFLHIMDFNGNQTVKVQMSFSAASKGFKRHQTMSKGHMSRLINDRFNIFGCTSSLNMLGVCEMIKCE